VLSNKHASINAETVEGITGREKICEMWFNHFKGLLNSCNDFTKKTRHYNVAVHLPVSQKAKGNTNICQK